jgi:hypothetical protein
MPQLRPHLLAVGVAVAAAGLAFASRLALIHAYGSDVPYMDEWGALGLTLFIPRSLGALGAANFLAAHNEHRIVLSRLLGYGLAVANRQWDPLLEMTVNATIHAGFCGALLIYARGCVKGVLFAAVALATTSLFVLSFDWENTLEGVQSQFYFLEWAALGMFLLCAPSEPLSRRWWLGLLVGIVGLGTMSTGFLAAAAVILVMAARSVLERRVGRRDAAAAALLAAICAVGLATIAHVPGHDILRAHSPRQWLAAAAKGLSWPLMNWPLAFLVLQLPTAALVAGCVRARRIRREESVLVCLALWTWLQTAAIAYARANFGMAGSPRYMDLYAAGSFANILALALMLRPGPRARAWAALAAAWAVLFSFGLWARNRDANTQFLFDYRRLREVQARGVRSFIATGDLARLLSAKPDELPYPMPGALASILASPAIRALLPEGIRPAIALAPDPGSSGFEVSPPSDLQSGLAGRTWIARKGPAHFVSQPLPGDLLPYLHVAMAGSPGLDASALRLESDRGSEPAPRFPMEGGRWHEVDLAFPQSPGPRLVVDIPPGEHWFAFSEPVELGRGSWLNDWLLRRSGPVAAAAGVLYAASCLALLALDLRKRPASAARP